MKPPKRDDLSELLHEWSDLPAPRAGLHRDVCEQFSATAGARQSPWTLLGRWFDPVSRSRGMVIGCVAAGVILGIGVAEGQAFMWRLREHEERPIRYLRWIDPTLVASVETARP